MCTENHSHHFVLRTICPRPSIHCVLCSLSARLRQFCYLCSYVNFPVPRRRAPARTLRGVDGRRRGRRSPPWPPSRLHRCAAPPRPASQRLSGLAVQPGRGGSGSSGRGCRRRREAGPATAAATAAAVKLEPQREGAYLSRGEWQIQYEGVAINTFYNVSYSFLLQSNPSQMKLSINDTCERIKEEFNFIQNQYHR